MRLFLAVPPRNAPCSNRALMLANQIFKAIHSNCLVYNTCWEDPRLDREALKLGDESHVMVITSAGCNALDYALAGARVSAVDVNFRQNALLELKLAACQMLSYTDFFAMFGRGQCRWAPQLYWDTVREKLSSSAQGYWDSAISAFVGNRLRPSFYFCGTSGIFARLVKLYIDARPGARRAVDALLGTTSLEEQRHVYLSRTKPLFWSGFMEWILGRPTTLALLGVPPAQRQQVERFYKGGIQRFIEDCIDTVFGSLSLRDNYFWRLYLTGSYTEDCCPEYLRQVNFERLRAVAASSVSVYTGTVTSFLRSASFPISHFVLLDHMDWLSTIQKNLLEEEWHAILTRAANGARAIWRSGGLSVDYVDSTTVKLDGAEVRVGDRLVYETALANKLHPQDRVHTYGSFYIAAIN